MVCAYWKQSNYFCRSPEWAFLKSPSGDILPTVTHIPYFILQVKGLKTVHCFDHQLSRLFIYINKNEFYMFTFDCHVDQS